MSCAVIPALGILREPDFRCNVDKASNVILTGFVELL
jgi:hypothetical protein